MSDDFPESTTNRNAPLAETTQPLAPKLFLELDRRFRCWMARLRTSPPRAAPARTRDEWGSARSRSDSWKPGPVRAPETPLLSQSANRQLRSGQLSRFFWQCRHQEYS